MELGIVYRLVGEKLEVMQITSLDDKETLRRYLNTALKVLNIGLGSNKEYKYQILSVDNKYSTLGGLESDSDINLFFKEGERV